MALINLKFEDCTGKKHRRYSVRDRRREGRGFVILDRRKGFAIAETFATREAAWDALRGDVGFKKWLAQLKRMPPDTPFTLYFDFTLGRGWMRRNLEGLGWSFNPVMGKWVPPEVGSGQ